MASDEPGITNASDLGSLDGTLLGYGHWLVPIQATFGNSIEQENQSTREPAMASSDNNTATSQRRGRGRPRMAIKRDDSVIEKRRAQIRSAQRTYRERKENAAASLGQRRDDLLRIISDVSSELEELLQVAFSTGIINQNNILGEKLRRMACRYDSAIDEPSLQPELRLLQAKSKRRQEEYPNLPINTSPSNERNSLRKLSPFTRLLPREETPPPESFSGIDLDRERMKEFTLLQPFIPFRNTLALVNRSIIDNNERESANP
ncbi:hypothetical protein AOQ84DRAFT_413498 [Glonium stellatum]|uniref:BZIP domain-containing protein n=1 Tax=Glonium stellatum TaxID=574774 RepID=A0A8E2EVL4_9PEZI|nr:hypothetical protein AOQ84DRAFT_413498 [Glonium stellatum]